MKLSLTIALSTLIMAAPALAEPVKDNSDAVTCQERPLPGMALVKGTVCKRNSEWARLNAGTGRLPGDNGSQIGPYSGDGMPPGANYGHPTDSWSPQP